MLRYICIVSAIAMVVALAASEYRVSDAALIPMTAKEETQLIGADGYFENCVELDIVCQKQGTLPYSDCPPDGFCGSYCPGGQKDEACEFALWGSCTGPVQNGCDGEPLTCGQSGLCVSANLGRGPNGPLCGYFDDCN